MRLCRRIGGCQSTRCEAVGRLRKGEHKKKTTRLETKYLCPGKRLSAVLPSLRADDPVVQYLGLSVGDIVRIDRPDGSVYYRLVIVCK